MRIKFSAIVDVKAALKAVERNGDALRYVKEQTWFIENSQKIKYRDRTLKGK